MSVPSVLQTCGSESILVSRFYLLSAEYQNENWNRLVLHTYRILLSQLLVGFCFQEKLSSVLTIDPYTPVRCHDLLYFCTWEV